MKVRILKDFRDKDDFAKLYEAGIIVEFSRERYQGLKALGLAEEVRERIKQPDKGVTE